MAGASLPPPPNRLPCPLARSLAARLGAVGQHLDVAEDLGAVGVEAVEGAGGGKVLELALVDHLVVERVAKSIRSLNGPLAVALGRRATPSPAAPTSLMAPSA